MKTFALKIGDNEVEYIDASSLEEAKTKVLQWERISIIEVTEENA